MLCYIMRTMHILRDPFLLNSPAMLIVNMFTVQGHTPRFEWRACKAGDGQRGRGACARSD